MAATGWYPGGSKVTTFPRPHNQPDIHYGGYGGIIRRRLPSSWLGNQLSAGGFVQNLHLDTFRRAGLYGGRFLRGDKAIMALTDKTIEAPGDLGWTIDYATAWLYRYLVSSVTDVADAIDTLRDLDGECMGPDFAYMFFDLLDHKLFAGKLGGAVHLRWRSMSSCIPGVTSAPSVIPDVPRICIELNRTPFQDDDAEVDDLLCSLIHQMIHAFFLVCCGAQPKDAKPDDRLMDGVHFGVILMTVRDLSVHCIDGSLNLIFHASKRRMVDNHILMSPPRAPDYPLDGTYISIDPRGHGHAAMLNDGRTHCNHDNRHISKQQIKNWQVTQYSKALEEDFAARGDKIWDFVDGGTFAEFLRIEAPPSATYIELVYKDGTTTEPRRIMAKREKALHFKSLKEPLTTWLKFELEIPKCDIHTFRCIYDFINKSNYLATPVDQVAQHPVTGGKGPPVLVISRDLRMDCIGLAVKDVSAITHIKVFKAAESLKFEELINFAIQQLYRIPVTSEDPILLLQHIYNLEPASSKPIHSELHRWTRRFLQRSSLDTSPGSMLFPGHNRFHASNLRKIMLRYPQQFRELLQQSRAFREDVEISRAILRARSPYGIVPTLPVSTYANALSLTAGNAMQTGLLPGIAASRGVTGLLEASSVRAPSSGIYADGFDESDLLSSSLQNMSLEDLDSSLLSSAPGHSALPHISRSISPSMGQGFFGSTFL